MCRWICCCCFFRFIFKRIYYHKGNNYCLNIIEYNCSQILDEKKCYFWETPCLGQVFIYLVDVDVEHWLEIAGEIFILPLWYDEHGLVVELHAAGQLSQLDTLEGVYVWVDWHVLPDTGMQLGVQVHWQFTDDVVELDPYVEIFKNTEIF
jgi:hypothetical protein